MSGNKYVKSNYILFDDFFIHVTILKWLVKTASMEEVHIAKQTR